MSNRRDFIKLVSLTGLGTVLIPSSVWANRVKEEKILLTILHTNDMHSHIDPFAENDPKYPNMGGMARRATLIKKIRLENPNTLLLDAGDIFQGTPYFNFFGGELEFKLMSEMKYDAATMGNHDFDNGIEGFTKMLPHAQFPFICSNYEFKDTLLKGKTIPHKIIKKAGVKIGIFGLGVELNGLVSKANYGDTQYLEPIKIANEKAVFLKHDQKCDLVVCLSHLGYSYTSDKVSDKILAAQTKNIDIIIGGHTHTFLDKPDKILNQDKLPVIVNQVGWAGLRLGRIDIVFHRGKSRNDKNNFTLVDTTNQNIC